MSATKLDLKKFLTENRYELAGPYGHQPDDEEIHYNIFTGSGDNKRYVGGLFYPDENESPMQGKISLGYKVGISEDKLGTTKITLNTQQIKETLLFREFLKGNNISYKEYKKDVMQDLRKIKDFLGHINLSLLEELVNQIG